MSHIHCRECNTQNPRGSKFCNKCGAPLPPSTSLMCPKCQMANPHNMLYCDNCGTRLVQDDELAGEDAPETPPKPRTEPFSLPSRPPGETNELDISLIPEWLRKSAVERDSEAQADIDDWLTQVSDEQAALEETDGGDWLSVLRDDLDDDFDLDAPSDAADDDALLAQADIPDWLADISPDVAATPAAAEPLSDDADDWLAALDETGATPESDDAPGAPSPDEDWLAALEDAGLDEPAEQPPAMVEAEPAETLPEWMQDEADEAPAAAEAEAPAAPDDALPGWLTGAEEDESVAGAGPGPDEPELPAWLREPAGDETVAEESAAEAPAAGELTGEVFPPDEPPVDVIEAEAELDAADDGAPAELPGAGADAPAPMDEPVPDAAPADRIAGQIDDWMASLEASLTEDTPVVGAADAAPGSDAAELAGAEDDPLSSGEPADDEAIATPAAEIPEWLRELKDGPGEADEAPVDSFAELMGGDETLEVPDWLADLKNAGADETAAASDPDIALPTPADEIPDWLGISTTEKGAPEERALADTLADLDDELLFEGTLGAPTDDLPDWLDAADITAPAPEIVEEAPDIALPPVDSDEWAALGEEEQADTLPAIPTAEAEIPSWLRAMQPSDEPSAPAPPIDEPEETSGPLAGLRGVIGIEAIMSDVDAPVARPALVVTPEQAEQVALLRELQQRVPPPIEVAPPTPPVVLSVLTRLALAGLLLLAIVVGRLVPDVLDAAPPPLTEYTGDVRTALTAVPDRPVLVAFDYGPAMAGELDLLATTLLDDLAANGNDVVAVTQVAAGTGVAERLLAGRSATTVGYVPAEAVGLRGLAGCIGGAEACPATFSGPEAAALSQSALIIVLTGERDHLLGWIEQVGADAQLPIVVGVTQSLAPVAAPYLASGQLSGALAGLPDAAAYARQYAADDAPLSAAVNGQSLAVWVVILLLVVGNILYGLTSLRPTSRAARVAPAPGDQANGTGGR